VNQASEPSVAEVQESSRSRRVLVVDDNVDAARSLAKLLSLKGHSCRTAFSGDDALSIAASFVPEAVVLDIGMPETDGYAVVRQLRAQPREPAPVLIAVTGWGQADDRRRSLESGFDHHLVKPVELDALHRLLTEA
jgi:CheY-like chemotaxis protein